MWSNRGARDRGSELCFSSSALLSLVTTLVTDPRPTCLPHHEKTISPCFSLSPINMFVLPVMFPRLRVTTDGI